jgi:hypothetical protein
MGEEEDLAEKLAAAYPDDQRKAWIMRRVWEWQQGRREREKRAGTLLEIFREMERRER